jgi:MATE family multidrug resistance protein
MQQIKGQKVSFQQINKLAIPSIIAGISEPLLSIVDTAVVGNIQENPTEALAAVGIAGSFIAAIFWVLGQTRAAISAIVAQYVGEKRLEKLQSLPSQIICFNLLISLGIYLLTFFLAQQIFSVYNAEGLVLTYAVDYYKIRALGLPLSLFIFTIFGVFTGMQNTFYPMMISIAGALLNVILDFLFVYGVEGFILPMHVKGAAYASLISQGLMAILALRLLYKKTPFKLNITFQFHPELKRMFGLSLNLFLRALALHITMYFANSYATSYGAAYIAAQTICFQIWLFFAFFIDGYASVGSIISGKQKGEKNFLGLQVLVKDLNRYAIIVSLILAFFCFLGYNSIGKIFTSNAQVLEVFTSVFWLVLLTQPINAIAFVYDGVFKGLAEAVVLRNTLFIATFIGFLPSLLFCNQYDLKLTGIWVAFAIWMCFRSGILFFYFNRIYLLKKR